MEIASIRRRHDENLAELSKALFRLQSNLFNKEKALDQIIAEKDQTIMEQQKVIRRLLKKSNSTSEQLMQPNFCEDMGSQNESCFVSPTTSIPQINEILVDDEDTPIELSISVPNLTETKKGKAPLLNRSISDNEEKEKTKKLKDGGKVGEEKREVALDEKIQWLPKET